MQEQKRNSMQKFTKKYLKFWEKLKIAQATYTVNPTKQNFKELALLRGIKWTDETRYTKAYLKEHKERMDKARKTYQPVATFFNNL